MTFILGVFFSAILLALSVMVFVLLAPFYLFIAGIFGLIFVVYPVMIWGGILRLFSISRKKTNSI